ncbi:unnamed protein product [Rotaria socialis]|uniref:RING-type domain-containing protein n=1 Tax=Rotaria socialis TaxID=392032 RepID=A0A821K0Q0_9BILA|nr:unnamed protein product [Rotaria socialis]CAF4726733.1 unnamed protein product [Rotaria socialis]
MMLNKTISNLDEQEQPFKRHKNENFNGRSHLNTFAEVEILKQVRSRTFSHWSHQNLLSREKMIRAGFFYCNVADRVICLYCNLIAQQWNPDEDDPWELHKSLSTKCFYVIRMLSCCETASILIATEQTQVNNTTNSANSTRKKLQISDESTLSRLVAARLDLPVSHRLLNKNFKLSIIKRCWEDQLRLKQDDFESDTDLLIACIILQKQIDHINGKKENIIVPSVRMRQIHYPNQGDAGCTSSSFSSPVILPMTAQSNVSHLEMTALSKPSSTVSTSKILGIRRAETMTATDSVPMIPPIKLIDTNTMTLTNLCLLCRNIEKRLACIPCGHFVTCVPCSRTLRSCPKCRYEIQAFVRVFI